MMPAVLVLVLSAAATMSAPPAFFAEESLHWDGAPAGSGFYSAQADTMIAAARFTVARACTVKAVTFYAVSGLPADSAFVWAQGVQNWPGPLRSWAGYPGAVSNSWTRIDFPAPYYCWANEDFWVGVRTVLNPDSVAIFSMDAGPMEHERGGWVYIYYDWWQLTTWGQFWDRNWNLRAIVRYDGSGVEEELSASSLAAAAASPVTSSGGLRYWVARPGRVEVTVLDCSGRNVRALVSGLTNAGDHTVVWDCRDDAGRRLSPGSYFYLIRAGGASRTLPVSVLR